MAQRLGLQGTITNLRRGVALAAALLLSIGTSFAGLSAAFALPAPALTLAAFDAGRQDSLRRAGAFLEVGFNPEGRPEQVRGEGAAQTRTALNEDQTRRVLNFLTSLDPADPQTGMSLALRGFLAPRVPAAQLEDNMFLKRDAEGKLTMTELGRRALLDILLASDGQLLEPEAPRKLPTPLLQADGSPAPSGSLASAAGRVLAAPNFAAVDPSAAFDGSRMRLGSFDWGSLGAAPVAAGGLDEFDPSREPAKKLEGYAYDAEKGTLRVMVAANRAVETDRIRSAGDGSAVLAETGLDQSLFEKYGAKVVRAVDNLVTVDIPLYAAASFGFALQDLGLESRPARVFKAAMGAMASPVGALLGGQFLPIPSEGTAAALASLMPKMVESRSLIEAEALERAGMRGKGSLVGIIDSGIDPEHADFKDADGNSRITSYLDFTGEGKEDVVGHGTHVAGTIGGTGAASGGAYRGTADQTQFKVAKVFGTKGETDESVILAAMKWMAGGGESGAKVDILNMSLGGPGDPNIDPLSSMANRLTVKDKVLVVAAAGNEGPWTSSVGSPGNARYALTVGGVNKQGEVAFFSSRGPIIDSERNELYGKPDVMGVSGDVDLSRVQPAPLVADSGERPAARAGLASVAAGPSHESCIYAPGVIAPRSSHDPDQACTVAGNTGYRYMSGTSMATPEVAGMAADVIAYLKSKGYEVDPFQVKAVIMETAGTLEKEGKDVQGAGLVNGTRLVQAVIDRVKRGLPVGNVAFALSMRLTSKDRASLERQTRYQLTPLGLLDTSSGRLVRDEVEIQAALKAIRTAPATQTVSLPPVEVLPS